jgi:hypothetical protein
MSDGGLTSVARHGDAVHRSAGDWTPTVHALLEHLQRVGFAAAPRPLGVADGVEILSFVPGGPATHSDEELARVGGLIRDLHVATRSFVAPPDARWQFMVGAPRDGGVICHNDLSPDNTVYEPAGKPRAFIDWDLAAPAPPLWDLAWAAYRFVPLYADADCERLGYPVGRQAERLRPSSATRTASRIASRSYPACAGGSASSTTRRAPGARGVARAGARCGRTPAASSGSAAFGTSRPRAPSGTARWSSSALAAGSHAEPVGERPALGPVRL